MHTLNKELACSLSALHLLQGGGRRVFQSNERHNGGVNALVTQVASDRYRPRMTRFILRIWSPLRHNGGNLRAISSGNIRGDRKLHYRGVERLCVWISALSSLILTPFHPHVHDADGRTAR